jgi:leucyl/phenylalanyl-tRNA---protein transferase
MPRVVFPPVESANEDGIVAIGGDLSLEVLLTAYTQGIFPWPVSKEYPLCWFSLDPRGIIDFKNFKIPTSFKKKIKKFDAEIDIKFNTNFEAVIDHCKKIKRTDQSTTWITDDIVDGYINLFHHGYAYSIEAYQDNVLSAGLYGVCIGDYFSGESMFHTISDLSKYCIYKLIETLKAKNIKWLDTQMVTPVVQSFGGSEIPRDEFMKMLSQKDFSIATSLIS